MICGAPLYETGVKRAPVICMSTSMLKSPKLPRPTAP